jgi:aminomethyltransferase
MTTTSLKRTALYDLHVELGAKLVEFGGWEMPLSYGDGTVAEHRACREDAVIFDVSHLGTVAVTGPGSTERLQSTVTNDLTKVSPGRAQYTHLLDADASVVDDIIVWWRGEDVFDVMPNASNTDPVVEAIGGIDITQTRAVIAIQGPAARAKVSLISPDAASVKRFHVIETTIGTVPVVVAGTGYTGEDGVEIAVPAEAASELFARLVDVGIRPAGLGARDTLRLEAGLPLHGHELGPGITPLDAGLGWVVGWGKPEFRGRDALLAQRERGPARRLVGITGDGRQPLRDGAPVHSGGVQVGMTSSGNFSPMLGVGIALAFIDADAELAPGDPVSVEVRGRSIDAHLSEYPFWPPRS